VLTSALTSLISVFASNLTPALAFRCTTG
jgi:hypothetical protein